MPTAAPLPEEVPLPAALPDPNPDPPLPVSPAEAVFPVCDPKNHHTKNLNHKQTH